MGGNGLRGPGGNLGSRVAGFGVLGLRLCM